MHAVRRLAPAQGYARLDPFLRALEECRTSAAAVQCMLACVRDCLGADVVCLYSPRSSAAMPMVGEGRKAQWCRDFAHRQLATPVTAGSQGMVVPTTDCAGAAMIRLSKSRELWIVALRLRARGPFDMEDLRLLALVRRLFLQHTGRTRAQDRLGDAVLGTIRGLDAAIAAKSPYTRGHSERVARMAWRLGKQMGLDASVLSDLYLAGLLHDIGKIGIHDSILQKPGELTEEEQAQVRRHPVIGDEIVATIRPLAHLRGGVRHHHERFDGFGYPDGLAGNDIPLIARILAVVDTCDALLSARPYRPGLPTVRVEWILRDGAGTQWDPAIVEQFLACREHLYAIYHKARGGTVLMAVEQLVYGGGEASCHPAFLP